MPEGPAITTGPARPGRRDFRPDIEGLRGLAVLLVILFHAGLGGVVGGFVGVDVFFVISGFLITGLLLRERERTGRIGFGAFYARRVRRLLPAAAVVVVVTLPLAWLIVDPLDRPSVAGDAIAAALSVGNLRFALAQGDYFTSVADPSPFLHFWSLAVEEQFYLVWPVLLLLATRARRPRRTAGLVLGLVLVASLATDLAVTSAAPSWAFYSLPTRAWQLALGGLLAVAARPLARLPGLPLAALGWLGLAGVIVAAVVLDPSLPYPGPYAILPTTGAALLIAAGDRRLGPGRLLSLPPIRGLGRISYSLYLWHWPILVLPAIALGADLPLAGRLGLVGVAIVAATLSCLLIEEPFRRGLPALDRRPGVTLSMGAATIALLVALGASASSSAMSALAAVSEPVASAVDPASSAGAVTEAPDAPAGLPWAGLTEGPTTEGRSPFASEPLPGSEQPTAPGSPAAPVPPASPATEPTPTTAPSPVPAATTHPASGWALPADVRPALVDARSDVERLIADGCLAWETVSVPRDCVYGDPEGSFTIALVGDSHASDLFPAVEAIAKQRGWRVETFVKVACPFADMPVYDQRLKREYSECDAFRAATIARLRADPPDITLVAMNHWLQATRSADATAVAQGAAMARAIAQLPGRVALMIDRPRSGQDVPACLSAHPDDIRKCAVPASQAFTSQPGTRERAAAEATGAGLVDLTKDICAAAPCPVVVRGMIVFRDNHHLTATFARSLAPQLAEALDRVIATRP